MAFVAGEGGRQVIVLDGSEFSGYGPDWSVSWPPCFSEAGGVVACRLTSRGSERGCVGVDGRRGEDFDRVGPPVLSRDGNRVAYRGHRGDRAFVVVDGERGPEFEYISDPAISADGRVVAYGAKREGRWWLVVGDRETPLDVQPSSVFLSADGASAGYTHSENGSRVRVVVDGKPGGSFSRVGRPVFSPDGQRVAYAADDGEKEYVVIDRMKIEVAGRMNDPVFSPDGSKVGYGARIGREIVWKVLEVPQRIETHLEEEP